MPKNGNSSSRNQVGNLSSKKMDPHRQPTSSSKNSMNKKSNDRIPGESMEECSKRKEDASPKSSVTTKTVVVSPFRQVLRIFYWGTLLAQFIITSISLTFLYCDTYFWPVTNSRGVIDWAAFIHLLAFCCSSTLTQYNFFMAIFVGPGYVPQNWAPEKEEQKSLLQYCINCEGFKAPRAHHCRKCGRCVQKMEHHCPWINNCVGHRNHAYFLRFLFFATIGCLHAMVVLLIIVLKILNFVYTDFYYQRGSLGKQKTWFYYWMRLFDFQPPPIFFSIPGVLWIVMMIGFALGVVLAVGALFVIQLRIILRNETSIESWIINKASYYLNEENAALDNEPDKKTKKKIHFVNPYNLGWWENVKQVFLNRTYNPLGDGIWWTTRPECDQFTLTKEQIKQKQFKQDASKDFLVQIPYGGRMFPILSQGWRVCLSFPWTMDEPRLILKPGDIIRVTRFQKHWLYGTKIRRENQVENNSTTGPEEKGWFPRRTARNMEFKTD